MIREHVNLNITLICSLEQELIPKRQKHHISVDKLNFIIKIISKYLALLPVL